jgi:transcriptional regulator with XRE-family HTH domain
MQELDKSAMGKRIKQIRLQAGMRQWELARLLGTTQSAVHKYEHGVVPEPRRLVELARIGRTSLEWILTGQHWESGSEEQERLTPDLLETAHLLRQIKDEERHSVDEALRIVRAAIDALNRKDSGRPSPAAMEGAREFHGLAEETLGLLDSAWRIQRAVLLSVVRETRNRLAASPIRLPRSKPSSGADESGGSRGD